MSTPRDGATWVLEHWDSLSKTMLENILSLKTPREVQIAEKFASVPIPNWIVEPVPAETERRSKRKRVQKDKVVYSVEIEEKQEFFEVLKKKYDGTWHISWLYTEDNIEDILRGKKKDRIPIMPGCAVHSTHTQQDFEPTPDVKECPEVSIVGNFNLDKQTLEVDERYRQTIDQMRGFLARGAGDRAFMWREIAWMAHPVVDTLQTFQIDPEHNKICDVCGHTRTVSYCVKVGEKSYYVGSECMQVVSSVIDVVRAYNDPIAYNIAMEELSEFYEN